MDPVAWTAVAGVLVSIAVGLVVPGISARRRARTTGDATTLDSWDRMTKRLQEVVDRQQVELDRQQVELDGIDAKYKARLAAMETEYTAKLDKAHDEIAQLRVELDNLYRRVGRQAPPLAP